MINLIGNALGLGLKIMDKMEKNSDKHSFEEFKERELLDLKTPCGKTSDKIGNLTGVTFGLTLISVAVFLLTFEINHLLLIFISIILGAGQAFISPSLTALVANKMNNKFMGTGMGTFGAIRNLGKVLGPIIGGNLQSRVGFVSSFRILSFSTSIIAVLILF